MAVTSNTAGIATFSNLSANPNSSTGNSISVTVSAPNYIPQTTSVNIACNTTTEQGIALLSNVTPGTLQGDIRIILTWGKDPVDLDSHLTGPKNTGTDRFHVYWSNTNNCSSVPCDSSISAWLDVDDTTSYGPETVSIQKSGGVFIAGIYRFSVHHYGGVSNIPASGASIKVYKGSTLLRTYTPPSPLATQNVTANWTWTVFEMTSHSDGSLSFAEIGTYQSISTGVTMLFTNSLGAKISSEDPSIFMGMPSK